MHGGVHSSADFSAAPMHERSPRGGLAGRVARGGVLVPPERVSAHTWMLCVAADFNSRIPFSDSHAYVSECRRFCVRRRLATRLRLYLCTASHMFTGRSRYAEMGSLRSPEAELYCDEWCNDTYLDQDTWHFVKACTLRASVVRLHMPSPSRSPITTTTTGRLSYSQAI
jgi:hypothetical protein